MTLGVRIDTASPVLATQFRRALNFWSRVIDMEWHEEASNACSLELTDARPGSLDASIAAQADGPESEDFEGWIRFNAAVPLTKTELYYYSVHEIGHLLGLEHNPSHWSVMYFEDTSGPERLDAIDLEVLGKAHTLRRPRTSPIYLQTSLWTTVGQVCFLTGEAGSSRKLWRSFFVADRKERARAVIGMAMISGTRERLVSNVGRAGTK